jgi:hypothetical protein
LRRHNAAITTMTKIVMMPPSGRQIGHPFRSRIRFVKLHPRVHAAPRHLSNVPHYTSRSIDSVLMPSCRGRLPRFNAE